MKSIFDTIDRILQIVPSDHSLLRDDLNRIRTTATYTRPDCLFERWKDLANVLGLRLPRGLEVPPWAQQIKDIFDDGSEAA